MMLADGSKWSEIVGASADLPASAASVSADELSLAVPSAEPEELRRLVAICGATKRLANLVSVAEGLHPAVTGYRSAAAG